MWAKMKSSRNPIKPRNQPNRCRGVSHTPWCERKWNQHTIQQIPEINRTSVGAYRIRPDVGENETNTQSNKPHQGVCLQVHLCASQMGQDIKAVCAEYLFMQQRLCWCVPEWLWMTPTTYGRDFAYCLKSHGGVRGFNASLWRFLLRCTLFCHSVATFLTSVSSYEGGCGFEVELLCNVED